MTINIIAGDTLYFNDTTLTVAGQYFFTLSAANGCDSIVKLHLDYEGVGINASPVGVCPGQMATLTTQGTHAARWQSLPEDPELATQQGRSVVRVHPRTTTTYFLLDNLGNIIASTIVGAEPAPRPCMDIQREVVDNQPQVTLQDCSAGSDFTVWRFSDGMRQTGSRMRREFEDPLPDNVTVKMTTCNSFNCCTDTSATLNLQVRTVWFPVSFNPTDGRNLFGCATSCEVEAFEIEIFSRMGLLLWSSNDINSQWDGSYRGIALPEGSYLYRWRLKEKNGKEQSDCGAVRLERE
jgi:gliding motility-associated-like protein